VATHAGREQVRQDDGAHRIDVQVAAHLVRQVVEPAVVLLEQLGDRGQAAPAPRFSRTPAGPVGPPPPKTTPLGEIGW